MPDLPKKLRVLKGQDVMRPQTTRRKKLPNTGKRISHERVRAAQTRRAGVQHERDAETDNLGPHGTTTHNANGVMQTT